MYYRDTDELPIKILLKIFETKDLTLLLKDRSKKGRVKAKELEEAWEVILNEYKELEGSNTADRVLRLEQRIDYLKAKHQMIGLCVYLLRLEPDERVEKILAEHKYRINPDDYEGSLDAIEASALALKTRIETKEAELERITKDSSVDKADINKMLASMSTALGIPFKFNEITVVEFFGYKDALKAKANAQPKPTKKGAHVRR